jgi:hypothetical protein
MERLPWGTSRLTITGARRSPGESEFDLELDDSCFEPVVVTGAAGETP